MILVCIKLHIYYYAKYISNIIQFAAQTIAVWWEMFRITRGALYFSSATSSPRHNSIRDRVANIVPKQYILDIVCGLCVWLPQEFHFAFAFLCVLFRRSIKVSMYDDDDDARQIDCACNASRSPWSMKGLIYTFWFIFFNLDVCEINMHPFDCEHQKEHHQSKARDIEMRNDDRRDMQIKWTLCSTIGLRLI